MEHIGTDTRIVTRQLPAPASATDKRGPQSVAMRTKQQVPKEAEVDGDPKAIIIFVPVAQLKSIPKIQA